MSEQAAKPSGQGVLGAFLFALGRLGDRVGESTRAEWPDMNRTPADALRGDWERLGLDMRRAVEKVLDVERV